MMASWGAWVAATSSDTSELTLMTDPPAAPALLLLATETGDDVVMARSSSPAIQSKRRGWTPCGAHPCSPCRECLRLVTHRIYGSFWIRVSTFCGTVLAWATIAVLACCRI